MTAEISANEETKSQLREEKPKPQLHSYWNFRSVVFQVENTLFSVLKHGFMEPGTPFETMFLLPPEDPRNVEGSSDDNPIILEDTKVSDFAAFLRVLYPAGVPKVDSCNDWLSVLRLSHKWNFTQVRKDAIEALTPHVSRMSDYDKISLGSMFLVQAWFREGLIDIAAKCDLEIHYLTRKPFCFNQGTIIKVFYVQSKGFECELDYEGWGKYQCKSCSSSLKFPVSGAGRDNPIIHYCPTTYRVNVAKLVDKYFAEEISNIGFNV